MYNHIVNKCNVNTMKCKNISLLIFFLGSDGDDDKIVIFGTEGFLRILCTAEVIFMDGTFKSALKLFLQIYTLHCFVQGIMVPMVII